MLNPPLIQFMSCILGVGGVTITMFAVCQIRRQRKDTLQKSLETKVVDAVYKQALFTTTLVVFCGFVVWIAFGLICIGVCELYGIEWVFFYGYNVFLVGAIVVGSLTLSLYVAWWLVGRPVFLRFARFVHAASE